MRAPLAALAALAAVAAVRAHVWRVRATSLSMPEIEALAANDHTSLATGDVAEVAWAVHCEEPVPCPWYWHVGRALPRENPYDALLRVKWDNGWAPSLREARMAAHLARNRQLHEQGPPPAESIAR